LYESITGQKFEKWDVTDVIGRVEKNINAFLSSYKA
jgi:hypothetical protein